MFRQVADNPLLILVLVLIIVVVFGANRLPGAARSLGRSLRIFKAEVSDMKDEAKGEIKPDTSVEGNVVEPRHKPSNVAKDD